MSENRIEPSAASAPPSVNSPSPKTFSSFAPGATTRLAPAGGWGKPTRSVTTSNAMDISESPHDELDTEPRTLPYRLRPVAAIALPGRPDREGAGPADQSDRRQHGPIV